ncbi:hypothetical protein CGRA01v4_06599 [Colletotrichum graminicola]|nr:hypothetical protein CGRA01v4_06599 [Colletotrichum graminicola]
MWTDQKEWMNCGTEAIWYSARSAARAERCSCGSVESIFQRPPKRMY